MRRADAARGRAGVFFFVFVVFLTPLAAVSLRGGTGGAKAAATPAHRIQADVAAGRELYQDHCSTCHGERGEGTALGPPVLGLGPAVYDFQLSTGRMPLSRPLEQAPRKPPSFNRRQIDSIIAFLTSLAPGGVPIPDVRPFRGNLPDGQRLYQDNCAPCHGTTGNGGAVGDQDAPEVHRATPTQIAEAVRIGPGAMPVFDATTLPDEDLDSLVRYVLYLRSPEDPGGAGLGRTGPIIEGFVALLLGLGVIIVVTRFIGERS